MARPLITESKSTFIDILDQREQLQRDKTALIKLDRDGRECDRISYADLIASAKITATSILKRSRPGKTCLIIASPGLDFAIALLACFYAGVIAVPVHPPRKKKRNERLANIIRDANPDCQVLGNEYQEMISEGSSGNPELEELPIILISRINHTGKEHFNLPRLKPDDIALLQYSSGTTGRPRGSMITHRNILHNSEVIRASFNHDPDLIVVTWLPPYHDMGLIGTLLQPIFIGGTNVIINPVDFLRNPVIWLEAISKYKGTTAGCPNFALDLLADRISEEQKEHIDLGSLKVFFCGSEPVRRTSLEKFYHAFKDCNFHEEMYLPCYGLAENTLMATGIEQGNKPIYIEADQHLFEKSRKISQVNEGNKAVSFVGCGYPWIGDEIKIADPDSGDLLPDKSVGEILIRGKAVFGGYWNAKNENTSPLIRKQTDKDDSPYLRTGDLGFYHEGQLFICGRIKDLIIIRGSNYFPDDIESSAENSHNSLQIHGGAAFSFDDGREEKLVIVHEVKRTALNELNGKVVAETIRKAIMSEHEIVVHAVCLIGPARLPKTTSGKKQRLKCREMWLNDQFTPLYEWNDESGTQSLPAKTTVEVTSATELEAWLIQWLGRKLKINEKDIDPEAPIMSCGLDSMGAVELEREVKEAFEIEIHLADIFENNTITALSKIGMESILKQTD